MFVFVIVVAAAFVACAIVARGGADIYSRCKVDRFRSRIFWKVLTKNHGCATLERDHSAQLFILCGLLLATSHHTRVVHDHNLLAGHRHMRRSGRRVCVPPSKPCPWPCGHGGTCLGRSNVRQRVVFCCWGVSWSFGSLASQRSSAGRIQGDVNSR